MNKKFRLKIGLITAFIFLGFFVLSGQSFGAECRLISALTSKSQVGLGEVLQINVTAQSECVGQKAEVSVCDSRGCGDLFTWIFQGKAVKVTGGEVFQLQPIVYKWTVPSDFTNQNINAYISARGPANTVKSREFTVAVGKIGELTDFSLTETKFNLIVGKKIDPPSNLNLYLVKGSAKPPYSWTKTSGSLPDGVKLSRDGFVSGTPKKEGMFDFAAKIEDSSSPRKSIIAGITINVLAKGADVSVEEVELGETGEEKTGEGKKEFQGVTLTVQGIEKMLTGLVCWIYRIAFGLIVIFIVLTGIRYMASGGNPTKVTAVHQAFKWVVIGAVVILGVGVIIASIAAALGLPQITPIIC